MITLLLGAVVCFLCMTFVAKRCIASAEEDQERIKKITLLLKEMGHETQEEKKILQYQQGFFVSSGFFAHFFHFSFLEESVLLL